MCIFGKKPKMPKIPDPRPLAPAPEKTAGSLTTGKNRRGGRSKKSSLSSGGGVKNTSLGSLRIPLKKAMQNLRY